MVAELRKLPREIHKHIRARGYIGSSALGVSDGLVTNLAFLSGFTGFVSEIQLIRIAGIASMLAGGISMFFSGFLAGRSEYDLFQADRRREAGEIEQEPEEEKSELRDSYVAKGLTEDEASRVVERIASNKEKFLEDILIHELHVHETKLESPFRMGSVIGLSFLVGAIIPLVPFLLLQTKIDSLITSVLVSSIFLFTVGLWKGRIVGRKLWRSGVETLIIGIAGAAVLYVIGAAVLYLTGTGFGFF
jgi:predicted membrane protein (TIGR00267 family)